MIDSYAYGLNLARGVYYDAHTVDHDPSDYDSGDHGQSEDLFSSGPCHFFGFSFSAGARLNSCSFRILYGASGSLLLLLISLSLCSSGFDFSFFGFDYGVYVLS